MNVYEAVIDSERQICGSVNPGKTALDGHCSFFRNDGDEMKGTTGDPFQQGSFRIDTAIGMDIYQIIG